MANTTQISQEEKWLVAYFHELLMAGIVKNIEYQPEPFILSEAVDIEIFKQLKTKKKYRFKTILDEHIYTPDFKITWASKNLFHKDFKHQGIDKIPVFFSHDCVSYVECKGVWDFNNMTRMFVQRTQPWIYQIYDIYINLIKVPDIFKNTFVPASILPSFYYKMNTAKNNIGDKKYPWKYKYLDEYLNE